MDLETENRIAAILLKEAAELRRRAEKEGVEVYLQPSKFRGRPNSRFLTATVLGVQQANRAVEENEMWQARQKELDLDDRLKGTSNSKISSYDKSYRSNTYSGGISERHFDTEADARDVSERPSCSLRKSVNESMRDDEIEQFLNARIKRGRGAVGSRMDETGPYLPSHPATKGKQSISLEMDPMEGPEKLVVCGPEKLPLFLGHESSEDESSVKQQKIMRTGSRKHCSRKHRSKDKSREKEKKKKEKNERSHKQQQDKKHHAHRDQVELSLTLETHFS